MIFPYFLVFLFPLGIYLLVLANINRRQKPVMIGGIWDSILLTFGLSGILLWVGPSILGVLYERGLTPGGAEQSARQFEQIWTVYPLVWMSYYVLVILGQGLMIFSRRDMTSVYNVDATALEAIVTRILGERGFATAVGNGLIIFNKTTGDVNERGAVNVESFLPLRHATLHWHSTSIYLRNAIEQDLAAKLDEAAIENNPATSWLLGTSGLLFGFVILGALMLILAKLMPIWRL